MRNSKEIQTDQYTTKRHLFITSALPIARQKLQNYFEGYSEFYSKIVFYLFNDFSRNLSTYSAELLLGGTVTCP
jgi:hypothetical protein